MGIVRCVLFDLGKVLVDFDLRRFGDRMRALTGFDAEQLRATITGNGLALRYESGQVDDAGFHDEICRRLGIQIPFEEFSDAWNSVFLPAPLLSDDLLASLAGNAGLWILSNTNPLHFNFISGRYSFMRHFRGYTVSYDVGSLKPDERIFQHALNKAGARANETFFVDDILTNVEAARGLGIDALQFIGAGPLTQELEARGLLWQGAVDDP